MFRLSVFIVSVFFSLATFAANITWTNGNGTGIWNDAGNWSAGIPGPADRAFFNGTSTADCLIDISIDVRGIILQTGYTGTVTQGAGNTIVVRDQDIELQEGSFVGGDSQIDMINGNFTIRGGSFTSTSDTLFLDVNFTVRDSGFFQHNNGTLVFDDAGNRNINILNRDTLFNLLIATTANNARVDLAAADTLVIINKLTLTEGRLRRGVIEVQDSVEFNTNYDGGTSQIWMSGSGNDYVAVNANVGFHSFYIAKDNSTDTVFVENPNGSTIAWGQTTTDLILNNGTLLLNEDADLNYDEIEIGATSTFRVSNGETRFQGSWDNKGGTFQSNLGTWIWDNAGGRTYASTVVDTFFNFQYDPSANNAALTSAVDDSIYIENRLELLEGRILNGQLLVHDTAYLYSNYDDGNADLWFVGTKTSNYLIESAEGDIDHFIRKTNATDTVYFEPLTGTSLNIGETNRDLTLQEGVLSLNKADLADLDFGDLIIQGGSELIASSRTVNYQGNWNNQGGSFNANQGQWIFDPIADNRTYISAQVDSFYNLEIDGVNNVRFNIDAADSIYIENKLELTNARFQTGQLLVEDTAILYSTYDDGSADLWFIGSTTSNFLIEAALGNFDQFIRKTNSTDTVFFQALSGNSLNIGEDDRDLTIQEGVLSFDLVETADLDFSDIIIQDGGQLQATSGLTTYEGNWNNQGGLLNANQGVWTWDHPANRTFTSTVVDTFYTLNFSPVVNDRIFTLAADDSLYVENRLDLINGRVNTGNLLIHDTAYLYNTYDDGSADLYFVGTKTSNFFIESAVGNFDWFIQKDNSTDTVFCQPFTGNSLTLGETDRDLSIQEGILSFDLIDQVDIDYGDLIIQAGGQLQASSGTTNYQGNWNNQGGLLNANQGDWIWDNTGNRTYATTVVDTFFNFNYDPPSDNARLTLAADDSIYFDNKLELSDGRIQAGNLLVHDTAYLYAAYDDATADLYFVGTKTSNFIIEAAQGNFDKFIRKTNSTDTVFYQPLTGNSLTIGETDRDLTIEEGVLSFGLVDMVDLDYGDLNIEPGAQLQASSGEVNYQGNWNNQGGLFNANNGDWIWQNNGNRTYASTVVDTFYNFNYNSIGNRLLTMAADDSIYIDNKLELTNGRIRNGQLLVHDTAYLYNTYDDGTADLYFVGTKPSNFIIESAVGDFDVFITKDNSSDSVYYQPLTGTSLNIGETDKDLTIQEGVLSFSLVSDANLDYSDINIQDGATLLASPSITRYQGNWNNIAGDFNHNNGTWIVDLGGDRNFTSHQTDTFFRMIFDPPNGNDDLTITTGDAFAVEQALFLEEAGIIGGSVRVLDSLEINTGYDNNGSADIFFEGSNDGTLVSNFARGNHDFFINKATSTLKVDALDEDGGALAFGNTNQDLFVLEGRLEFPSNDPITSNFVNTELQDGGTYQVPSGTLNFNGNWNNNQGKVEANGGTFIHRSGSNRTYNTTEVDTFFNFTYNPSSNNRILSMGSVDTIRVINELVLSNGRVRTGVLSAIGNVTVQSGYDPDAAQATLQFVGPNPQTFDLTGGTNRYDGDIILDKSVAEDVTLNSVLDIDQGGQSITFNKGYFVTTQTNVLFVDGAHDMIGPNDSSYVKGPVTKRGNQTFSFPVGDTVYAPLTISSITSGSAQFRAQYFRNDPSDDTYDASLLDAGLNNVSIIEYWLLDRLATGANCRVNLSWRPTSAVVVPGELTVARWNAGALQWEDQGSSFTTGDANNGTITSPSIGTFSPFVLASTSVNNPLPVTYKYFEAIKLPSSNLLEWVTLSEINADYFEVQKSNNGEDWNSIGTLSANGNSTEQIKYQFTDLDIVDPLVYYRLKQIDFDGSFEYSEIRSINREDIISTEIKVYPNPASNGLVTININKIEDEQSILTIYSIQGKAVYQQSLTLDDSQRIELDISGFAKGTYFIRIDSQSESVTEKLIIL